MVVGFVGSVGAATSTRRASRAVCNAEAEDNVSRREMMKSLAALAMGGLAMPAVANAEAVSGRSVVNGVLSAYGLPQIPDASDPSAWLVTKEQEGIDRPRLDQDRVVATINVGDYRKAESMAFYSTSVPGTSTFDVPADKLGKIAVPLPNSDPRVIKERKMESNGYRLTSYKYDTYTTSGFAGERRALVASIVVDDTLFVLAGVCNQSRYKKVEPLFLTAMENFRVSKVQSVIGKTKR